MESLANAERDAHGHLRLAEINLGEILKAQVADRLQQLGIKTTIAEKNIGYELRCADPIPFDMEYTRDLGYCAAKYLVSGGNAAMVSMQGGHFVPIPFATMIDSETGRTRVRLVDIASTRYAIARRYMIRLRKDDFEDAQELAKSGQHREADAGRVPQAVRVSGGARTAAAGHRPAGRAAYLSVPNSRLNQTGDQEIRRSC